MAKGGFTHLKDSDKHQISLRKASQNVEMGEEAIGILYSFGLSDDNRKKYKTSPRLTLLSKETLSMNQEV